MSHHTSYTLAGLCAVGGVTGFAKSRSIPSLVAGLGIGGLYALSGYMIQNNKDNGFALATGASLVLSGAMVPRAIKTKKLLPIAMSGIGLAGVAYHSRRLYQEYNGV